MSYNLKWIGNNAIIKFSGILEYGQVIEANDIIYGDSRFDNMRYQICDFSKVKDINVRTDEVKIISALEKNAARWNNSIKIACISKNSIITEFIDQYAAELQNTGWICKVFKNHYEAEKWCAE